MTDTKKFLDQEGVKHLWSKVNMQDYPNNETLIGVINAIDETKANKEDLYGEAEVNYTILVDNITIQGVKTQTSTLGQYYYPVPMIENYVYADYPYFTDKTWSGAYKGEYSATVIWDDIRYEVNSSEGNGMECLAFGNTELRGRSNADDSTGLPFLVAFNIWYESAGLYIYVQDELEHTISVYAHENSVIIKQIEEKYIPNTIARVSDIITPVQSDWNEIDKTSLAYIKNKPNEDDALELLGEMGIIEATAAADGSIYIEDTGVIYTL